VKRFFAAFIVCAAVTTGAVLADSNTGWIYGRVVVTGTRQPVCPITIIAINNRESPWETHTRSDGSFYFLSLLPGRVTIIIGRNRVVREVEVHANLPTEETFYVAPARRNPGARRDANVERLCGPGTYGGFIYSDYDINGDWLTGP